MYRVLSQSEHHAYSASGTPPKTVHLTAGNQYILSVRGGAKALADRGVSSTTPNCTWSVDGAEPQALTVSAGGSSAKGTNAVATFIAPYTGDVHIECAGFGGIYVDDADNSPADTAGWYLFAGVLVLAVGGALGVSAARDAAVRSSTQRAERASDEPLQPVS